MGSQTPRCPAAPRHCGASDIAFDHEKSLGTFGTYQFRRSIPGPLLPTLHRHPHGYRCTARGESWIGSSFFPGTLTLTPPPVSLAHSHPDCRTTPQITVLPETPAEPLLRALQPSPKGVSGVPPHSVDGLLRASARRFGRLTTSAHRPGTPVPLRRFSHSWRGG